MIENSFISTILIIIGRLGRNFLTLDAETSVAEGKKSQTQKIRCLLSLKFYFRGKKNVRIINKNFVFISSLHPTLPFFVTASGQYHDTDLSKILSQYDSEDDAAMNQIHFPNSYSLKLWHIDTQW